MPDHIFLGGETNTTIHVESDDTLVVEEKQDAQGIVDLADICRNERFDGYSPDGSMQHVAEIPFVLAQEWKKQGFDIFNPVHAALLEKKLKDDYPKLLAKPALIDPHIIVKGAR